MTITIPLWTLALAVFFISGLAGFIVGLVLASHSIEDMDDFKPERW